jgi:RNA polymerase sigma-70 factor (ECF subfamily)
MAARALRAGPLRLVTSEGTPMTSQPLDWSAFFTQLQRFVASRVRSAADADDLVQVILERAMRKAHEAEIDNAVSWLFGVARNAIADHYRSEARSLVAAADALDTVGDPLGASDEERAAVIACMTPLLNLLPAEVAQLLRWADMEGRSMRSIAAELGISLTAAKSRVQRARKDFVKATTDCCAITVDGRGRVTELTRRSDARAKECAACVTDRDAKDRNPHEC